MRLSFAVVLALSAFLIAPARSRAAEGIQFNRDIRPILSDNCFFCHGPDAGHRQADLRLDIREDAIAGGAIEPGEIDASELVARILSDDPDLVMPPPDSNKRLTAEQIETLRTWVAEGAAYQLHWAYEPPVKPEIPAGEHAIDHLVRQRLAQRGLSPSPRADRRTLIRRLHTDLLGLPPSPEAVDEFVRDGSPDAYERLVDRLLQSPHYGERMAIGWLDVVRYADTIGYHSDNPRNVWPYRDWVIRSFNENKPFDRFTIEQIAGDLLPDADVETRVGSAFNRLLLSTEEGGAQPKDYESRMLTDRVRAVGAAWMGQTTGCAQCHDHKFDPFSMRDFYSLGAFFADIQEPILGRREEGMAVTTAEQEAELARLDERLAQARRDHDAILPALDAAQQQWEADLVAYQVTLPELREGSGASAADQKTARDVAAAISQAEAERTPAQRDVIRNYYRGRVTKLFSGQRNGLAEAEQARAAFYAALPKCLVSTSTPNKRTVRILPRGDWMNESGEIVSPALPHYLPGPTFEDREPNRLDLANWLVSPDNPLTARTVINRTWKQFFGTGLSKVLDDLGAQGEPPVHPELLDWLATEFVDSGWDLKRMIRAIVTSETYQQVSQSTPELQAADPYNRLLARQSAFRVDAELVRDHALAVSGSLTEQIGGPSVKPYQPLGYWENLNFPTRKYDHDAGKNQYRRGLYTWWQRSFLHPSLLAFDAPNREECTAERNQSNIPQQALVLLNDPTYVEAARAFAGRILTAPLGDAATDMERIEWAWRQALQRLPSEQELRLATDLLAEHRSYYLQDIEAAGQLLDVGLAPNPASVSPVELASWTHVARVLLNLHESITRS
ncbi:MAG: DUF1553 domain-containing protein [Planctomycetaceae bacterium]|nr:MAG: DUF1553 domain-containing protein [Planctomycetaceae bacterium]